MIHDFPTIEEVVAIHDVAIREFGGSNHPQPLEATLPSMLQEPGSGEDERGVAALCLHDIA